MEAAGVRRGVGIRKKKEGGVEMVQGFVISLAASLVRFHREARSGI